MTSAIHRIMIELMKYFWPILFIALGVLFIFLGASTLLLAWNPQKPAEIPLPEKLAGLPAEQTSRGQDALKQLGELHGNTFTLDTGAISNYGTQMDATLWVAGVRDANIAGQLVIAMTDRIAQNPDVFQPTGQRQDGSRTIYELEGMGQKHYYFQSGSLVIWLTVRPNLAEQALKEILTFYP